MSTSPSAVMLDPAHVLRLLTVIILVFGFLHLISMPVYVEGMKAADGFYVRLARKVMLQTERAVPTWFAAFLLALNMVLLWFSGTAIRQLGRGSGLHWFFLSAIFAFLSLDESLVIHEAIGVAVSRLLDAKGLLTFPWIVPGAVFTTIVALAYVGFLRRLPRRTALLFVASGAIFVGGALGMEAIESYTVSRVGFGRLYYLQVLVEECLEMFGQALFAYAILDHLARLDVPFRISSGR
ncbi:hypothetical protein [Defluviimonas sp. SAOS-178_SWC]|uniref:hypothetical protein n=1 Tax=Defluviimonas sp. SAOS-178_SWC TaxID=3121287 RepID=UPI00322201B0